MRMVMIMMLMVSPWVGWALKVWWPPWVKLLNIKMLESAQFSKLSVYSVWLKCILNQFFH